MGSHRAWIFLGLLAVTQASCMIGWQRGQGGMGGTPSGVRVAPEGAPAAIGVAPSGAGPTGKKLVLVPLLTHDDHRHSRCDHPSRVVDERTLWFYQGRWETEVDGTWMEAPDEPPPRAATHPNAPR